MSATGCSVQQAAQVAQLLPCEVDKAVLAVMWSDLSDGHSDSDRDRDRHRDQSTGRACSTDECRQTVGDIRPLLAQLGVAYDCLGRLLTDPVCMAAYALGDRLQACAGLALGATQSIVFE